MKSNAFVNSVKLGAIALTLSILPAALPAQATGTATDPTAPTTTAPGATGTTDTTGTTGTVDTTTTTADDNDGFDWGWLGLLGLIGLAGLAGKRNNDEPVRYSEPDVPSSRTTNRY